MGDFSENFRRPESGIHTVEGNVAGSRAAALTRKREKEQADYESRKRQIRSDSHRERQDIHSKFDHDNGGRSSAAEKAFRERTVGLVTAEEFRRAAAGKDLDAGSVAAAREAEEAEREKQREAAEAKRKKERKRKRKQRQRMMSTLSFANEEDAADLLNVGDRASNEIDKVIHKNPDVDTSFLPDREREAAVEAERERLRSEWFELQKTIQSQPLEIVYSYWDGSGHRRTVRCKKGDTVGHFLELVRKDLAREFREMTKVSGDALLYVKEDLIIPHDVTFYDLIATKARGKSGPLFNFDVHDDVRVGAIDVRVEKDESHPGKVVERRWYDRNKHIFPASRWEVFDPAKDYGRYTIHGGEVNVTKDKKKNKM